MGVHVVTVLEATILSAAGVAWLVSDVHGTHRRHCQRTYLIFFFFYVMTLRWHLNTAARQTEVGLRWV